MRRVSIFVIALLGIAAVLPAVSSAQDNSAIDQYTENVPGADGGTQSGGGSGRPDGTGPADGSGTPLPSDSAEELRSHAGAGAATADLAQATAPDHSNGSNRNESNGDSSPAGRTDASTDSSGVPSVGDVVRGVTGGSDSGGLGIWLPITLGATLLVAIALGLARWRRGPGEPTQA